MPPDRDIGRMERSGRGTGNEYRRFGNKNFSNNLKSERVQNRPNDEAMDNAYDKSFRNLKLE